MVVLSCVSLTLVDIIGFLHFWKMTIDVTSCISIVLAIGLCVDYSVHIAHAYLIAQGTQGGFYYLIIGGGTFLN